jgi:hypothetical protein
MASLAKGREIRRRAVRAIVVKVRGLYKYD